MSTSMMQFTVADNAGPPPGIYKAVFQGVVQTDHPEYGAGARFDFKVAGGEHDGKIASRTGKPQPSPKNATGRLLAGLLGGQVQPGQTVSLAACIGKNYTIVVGLAPSGNATRVESVMPAN